MRIIFLFCLLLAITSTSQAETWKRILIPLTNEHTYEIFIDKNYKKIANGKVIVRHKEYIGFVGSYNLEEVELDCKNRTATDLGGRLIDQNDHPTQFEIEAKPIIDLEKDAAHRLIFEDVCSENKS